MEENKPNHSREKLKDENAFLKMKLMLEHGAEFGADESNEMPPEIENMFLHNVMAFEEQYREKEKLKVYDVIERPTHFPPVNLIPEDDIHDSWNELKAYLNKFHIDLSASSPAITERELYRFTIEELFDYEMYAMSLPGWNYNFIYDEFHPDPEFEATRCARDNGIRAIFSKQPLKDNFCYMKENLQLNLYHNLRRETFINIINRFKESFDDMVLTSTTKIECQIEGDCAEVKGSYRTKCLVNGERLSLKGEWIIGLVKDEDNWWAIRNVQISGIEF